MTVASGRFGLHGVKLLCLDAMSLSADSDTDAEPVDAAWSAKAARLLGHARGCGWSVGHVISPRPRPGAARWRPLAGLAPEPSEPVYHREEPSAFASPDLCAAVAGSRRLEVVLCGLSVRGSGLATALDALRLEVRLTIATDAAWLPQAERDGLEGVLQLQRSGLTHDVVRLAPIRDLLRPGPPLRVLQGGRP